MQVGAKQIKEYARSVKLRFAPSFMYCKEKRCFSVNFDKFMEIETAKPVYMNPKNLKGYLVARTARKMRKTLSHSRLPVEVSGFWSLEVRDINFDEWYRIHQLKAHFLDGVPWDEVESIVQKRRKLNSGLHVSDVRSHEELDKRMARHDEIFEVIRRSGNLSTAPQDLITLNISENGGFYFGPSGQHRIAMAFILKLKSIPFKLGYIHTKGRWALEQLLAQNEEELRSES